MHDPDLRDMSAYETDVRRLAVIGLGHVGLPTAILFGSAGVEVLGVDIDTRIVEQVNAGIAPVIEPGLDSALARATSDGRIRASAVPEPADAFIIAVPTPLAQDGTYAPDISHVIAATRSIAPVLKAGDLIILESTSPVGTTGRCVEVIGELRRDLTMPGPGVDGDIDVVYSPERVLPGNALNELVNNHRVVGGVTKRAAIRAAALYKVFVKGHCLLTSDRNAEMVKLAENIFRDVNIALANELSRICDKFGLDVWEIIEIANHHPRVSILSPGPGVGGHCIPVDPWFVVSQAPEDAKLIRAAREVNDDKPQHIIDLVAAAAAERPESRIACFGLSYKPDIDDFRGSPSLEIVLALADRFGDRVIAVEPHEEALRARNPRARRLRFASPLEALQSADIIVLLVGHSQFKRLDRPDSKVVIDTIGLWR
jgi:UDP-N-acetyl-D-mannosaminuronic acid dehydrogenase